MKLFKKKEDPDSQIIKPYRERIADNWQLFIYFVSLPIQLLGINRLLGSGSLGFGVISLFLFLGFASFIFEKLIRYRNFDVENYDFKEIFGLTEEKFREFTVLDTDGNPSNLVWAIPSRRGDVYKCKSIDWEKKIIVVSTMHNSIDFVRDYKKAMWEQDQKSSHIAMLYHTLRFRFDQEVLRKAVELLERVGAMRSHMKARFKYPDEDQKEKRAIAVMNERDAIAEKLKLSEGDLND